MINAYKNFFKGYAEFTGRSTRPDYWWVWLGNFILSIPFWVIYIYTVYLSAVMDSVSDSVSEAAFMIFGLVAIIYVVFYLAILVPTIALTIRRLRDAGFHWAFIFLRFAPMVGGIALLILLAMPTKETEVVNYSEPQAVKNEEAIEDTPFEESDKN